MHRKIYTLQVTLSFGCDVMLPTLSFICISNLNASPFSISMVSCNISSLDGGPKKVMSKSINNALMSDRKGKSTYELKRRNITTKLVE